MKSVKGCLRVLLCDRQIVFIVTDPPAIGMGPPPLVRLALQQQCVLRMHQSAFDFCWLVGTEAIKTAHRGIPDELSVDEHSWSKLRSKSNGMAFAVSYASFDVNQTIKVELGIMTSIWEQLETAFVDDHRTMTRGYVELLAAIQSRDFASASRIAARLDELAGPRIGFEEQCLYPEVKKIRGDSYTSRLYEEHDEVLRALAATGAIARKHSPRRSCHTLG